MDMASKDNHKDTDNKLKLNGHNKNEDIPLKDVIGDNDVSEVEIMVPPNGGWGWVIVAASFMCNVAVDGIIFSFGSIQREIVQEFGASKARVALVGSFQTGLYLMSGPFVSTLANRYGFRLVAILGSVISCIAFVLSYFCTSVEYLYISFGVLGGLGNGLIYGPSAIIASYYFDKWRPLATGIASCGSGIGAFAIAPLTDFLISSFGWRETLIIQGGMLLNCAVFAALFRPVKQTRLKITSKVNGKIDIEKKNPSEKGSVVSLQVLSTKSRLGTNNNTDYPTVAEMINSTQDLANSNSKSLHSLHRITEESQMENMTVTNEKRLSVPINHSLEIDNIKEESMNPEEDALLKSDSDKLNGGARRHTISGRRLRADSVTSQKSFKLITSKSGATSKEFPQRPYYRDDIFYSGSLTRLSQYKSQASSVGYNMSVTRLPTTKDIAEEKSGQCIIFPESFTRLLSTMLDFSLLKSPSFLILATSGLITMTGFYTPYLYLTERAQKAGMDPKAADFLVSVIGIGNTIGRVVFGIASSFPGSDATMVNNVFISMSGLCTILSGLSLTQGYQYFYSFLFGLGISVFSSLRPIIVVDLIGLEKLTNGFGLLLLFQGVGAIIGSPLSGAFMDLTGSYNASFYLSGALIFLSALICYPLKRINEYEKSKASLAAISNVNSNSKA